MAELVQNVLAVKIEMEVNQKEFLVGVIREMLNSYEKEWCKAFRNNDRDWVAFYSGKMSALCKILSVLR